MSRERIKFEHFLLKAHKALLEPGQPEPGTSPGWMIRRFLEDNRQMMQKRMGTSEAMAPYRIIFTELVFGNTETNPSLEEAIWEMMYNGHTIENQMIFGGLGPAERVDLVMKLETFLNEAFSKNEDPEMLRGPTAYERGDWLYMVEHKGNFVRFNGKETLFYLDQPVWESTYNGQLLI